MQVEFQHPAEIEFIDYWGSIRLYGHHPTGEAEDPPIMRRCTYTATTHAFIK